MILNDLSNTSLNKNNLKNKEFSDFLNDFSKKLNQYFEKGNRVMSRNKYSEYWDYKHFIEDDVSMMIGISRWSSNITFYDNLNKTVNDNILEIANKFGTLYRNQFLANGSINGEFYNVKKFENGTITTIKINKDDIPENFQDKDIVFQIKKDGTINVREDLKIEVINNVSKELIYLKDSENRRNDEYKKEGHIYEAIEDDGYVFLNDLTEKRGFVIEDIDFVVDSYNGDGKYQVINGEYKKLYEN